MHAFLFFLCLVPWTPPAAKAPRNATVIFDPHASFGERLAARELCRYVYLRTGRLLPVARADALPQGVEIAFVTARKDRALLRTCFPGGVPPQEITSLDEQGYCLIARPVSGQTVIFVAGGGERGVLYGAYRLAERLGVRFFLHGAVAPDRRVTLGELTRRLSNLHEQAEPLFSLRGIHPFHDFPEGPDWWGLDDYKAVISRLPTLGMNFIGFHTYPEKKPHAEPLVWIGPPEEVGEGFAVKGAYPACWQSTPRGKWGYEAMSTGDFLFGGAELFDRDDYGPAVMKGGCPEPRTDEEARALFARAGAMLHDAFLHAHRLGVQTCVGTEIPLTVPEAVAKRLRAAGRDPAAPETRSLLYEGIFLRLARTLPLDWYWFWTPEGWTWSGAKKEEIQAAEADLRLALEAWSRVKAPFRPATCGWVLGPPGDRALFDRILPEGAAVSCINRNVGNTPVDPAFAEIHGRPKWAIPWLEDDPGLTIPQLWAGRMRRDARDALRYGCTGLMGIHWRTRVLGPNVRALARAAWTQAPWAEAAKVQAAEAEGPEGGKTAAFRDHAIAGTEDDPLYRTVRYDLKAYRFSVPDGEYRVILKFCEPHYGEGGKRVFGVKIQGERLVSGLDIFAVAGKDRALDFTFDHIPVEHGVLRIEFVPEMEFPCIAAVAVEGPQAVRKVNCGGGAYRDWAADPPPIEGAAAFPPVLDLYLDWARTLFGPAVAAEAGGIFARMDGRLPRPAQWAGGPGGMTPDPRPWTEVRRDYVFVDELAALAPRVEGPGNRARFQYWLDTFETLRLQGEARCLWHVLNRAIEQARKEEDPEKGKTLARQAVLPAWQALLACAEEAFEHLLSTVSNTGELGTVTNWEQHLFPSLLLRPMKQVEELLGRPLPEELRPGRVYEGPPRIIVPTLRSLVEPGETLHLEVILLGRERIRKAALYWRPMGKGAFRAVPLTHAARDVYFAEWPTGGARGLGYEYYVEAETRRGAVLREPPAAPELNHTVVTAE